MDCSQVKQAEKAWKERGIQCPYCDYKAGRKEHLERHVKTKHWSELNLPPPEGYMCEFCHLTFAGKDSLQRHMKRTHPDGRYSCRFCKKTFQHKENWISHDCQREKTWCCRQCPATFTSHKNLQSHLKEHEGQRGGSLSLSSIPEVAQQQQLKPDDIQKSANGLKEDATFKPQNPEQQRDLKVFLKESLPRLEAWLKQAVTKQKALKWSAILQVNLIMSVGGEVKEVSPYLKTKKDKPFVTTAASDIPTQIHTAYERLEDLLDGYTERGSGWRLRYVEKLIVESAQYTPLRGSTYLPLHPYIRDKKAVVNIKNQDNQCFKWAILSALHPAERNPQRVDHYKQHETELDFTGISFPVDVLEIDTFEKQNPDISVTVVGYEDPKKKGEDPSMFPMRIAPTKKSHHITLLYWEKNDKSHYAWVKSLSRLLYSNNHHKEKKFFCERCFCHFTRRDLLQKHEELCKTHSHQKVEVSEDVIEFKNVRNSEPAPFIIYADFESILKSVHDVSDSGKTERIQKHIPCSYAWALVSSHPEVENKTGSYCPLDGADDDWIEPDECEDLVIDCNDIHDHETIEALAGTCDGDAAKETSPVKRKRDTDDGTIQKKMKKRHHETPRNDVVDKDEEMGSTVVEHFLDELLDLEEELWPHLKENKTMTDVDYEAFKTATECVVCHQPFRANDKKVRDHDHATGEYRGAAHNTCNLQKQRQQVIPVVIHNLRGYDAHLIMRKIHKYGDEHRFSVIPNNQEKYVSFTLGHLRFIDSVQFLNESLDSLAKNLSEFPILESMTPYENVELLKKKGVYPYEYITSFNKLKETALPPQEAFHSQLNNEGISDEDYSHAQRVWKAMNCHTLKEYHDVYLLTDVLLLADVFQQFRSTCREVYQLDPAHYFTAPGLAWDAALKYTGIQLEPIPDVNMHLFLEAGMRGGVSTITHRHAKANNPYLEDYDMAQPSSYIMYLDANNLYGWAMSQPLPTHDFQWVTDVNELETLQKKLPEMPEDSPTGYILEVDLEYPQELHDLHNDYPLAPENLLIHPEMWSPYTRQLGEKLQYKPAKVQKLVPNLQHKEKYILHYRNLKYYLEKGMTLIKIHRAIKFKQQAWLKSYIDLNTQRRSQAKNNFEKNFFKLMNNSVFGKTMENIRNRRQIDMAFTDKKFKKLINKPTYLESKTFLRDEDDGSCFIVVESQKTRLKLVKPIYTGFSVLDLSKLWMYKFHYDVMLNRYTHENLKLLFTDTDSLTYHVRTPDVYTDMEKDLEWYDTSDYPKDSSLHSTVNKKVIGKFKDENSGVPLAEFVGLRSKMYAMSDGNKEKKTAKGIKKCVVKKEIKMGDYKNCLFQQQPAVHEMLNFRSHEHVVFTEKLSKCSLSPFDDKRYILEDGVSTRAYGHYKN